MTKSKKPRAKREPNARVKLLRDLHKEHKALRLRIRELIFKQKAKLRDIKSLGRGHGQARAR